MSCQGETVVPAVLKKTRKSSESLGPCCFLVWFWFVGWCGLGRVRQYQGAMHAGWRGGRAAAADPFPSLRPPPSSPLPPSSVAPCLLLVGVGGRLGRLGRHAAREDGRARDAADGDDAARLCGWIGGGVARGREKRLSEKRGGGGDTIRVRGGAKLTCLTGRTRAAVRRAMAIVLWLSCVWGSRVCVGNKVAASRARQGAQVLAPATSDERRDDGGRCRRSPARACGAAASSRTIGSRFARRSIGRHAHSHSFTTASARLLDSSRARARHPANAERTSAKPLWCLWLSAPSPGSANRGARPPRVVLSRALRITIHSSCTPAASL